MNGQAIRATFLEVLAEYEGMGSGYFQSEPVLKEVSRRLNARQRTDQQAILTLFSDLFRNGQLAWGVDLANPNAPFMHLTEVGRQTLRHISRDPANPDGYLSYLEKQGGLNEVAKSYIEEALKTYNSNCFKAAAVMTGAAAESVVLELRDAFIKRVKELGKEPPKDLSNWQLKRVLDALKRALDQQKNLMPGKLSEAFEAYWPAFTQQIRVARNDAGHPSGLNPVTPETVHASLLIFPELVKVSAELKVWLFTASI